MSLLSAVFGEANATYRAVRRQPPPEACIGHALQPRWRGPDVMGDDSRAMGFICHVCGREYLPMQVRNRRPLRTSGAR